MALATFLNAILSLLLPLPILLDITFPPLTLLLGASLGQEVKYFAVLNFLMPPEPTSLIMANNSAETHSFYGQ